MLFTDRLEAGRRLAGNLEHLRTADPVVLALPRGGVPVAYPVARALDAPLDVILVRKLGVPTHPEVAYGALSEDGVRVLNDDVLRAAHAAPGDLEATERTAQAELSRQAERFRGDRPALALDGRTAVVVDDGIATGATATAACRVAAAKGASRVVLAVPVAPPDTVTALEHAVDEVLCLTVPETFSSVGEWYRDFSQTSDGEVVELIGRSRTP